MSNKMKFDFAIGNPPYQDNNDTYNRLPPIYPAFYDSATEIADKSGSSANLLKALKRI